MPSQSKRQITEDVFAQAVAQGMHSPFSLDCEYWGRQYADKLEEALNSEWDTFVQGNKDATMERWRAEISRLRNWIDTEGRNCPSDTAIDAVLEESVRAA